MTVLNGSAIVTDSHFNPSLIFARKAGAYLNGTSYRTPLFAKDVLCWLSVSLSVLSKVDCKFLVSFEQIQNFKVSSLAMAKVKKVNMAVTYSLVKLLVLHPSLIFFSQDQSGASY